MLNWIINRRISAALLVVLCLLCSNTAKAEITNYGSVLHHSDAPNVLYFISKIEGNDTFEVRKALRNHDIKTLVLASPGGSVLEALNIAGMIFDRKIDVIVPAGGKCASACAYLFFAGNQRLANGEVGVHQFSSVEKEPTKDTEAVTQFTTSEIIGFLNEFGTPPFVFERMFQQRDMYWFNAEELLQLQTERSLTFEREAEVAEKTLKLLLDEITESVDDALAQAVESYMKLSRREKVRTVQEVLNSRSCPVGSADGIMGQKTKYGLQKAAATGGIAYSAGLIDDESFIKFLFSEKTELCEYELAAPRSGNSGKSSGAAPRRARQPFYSRYSVRCDGRLLGISTFTYNPARNFGQLRGRKGKGVINFKFVGDRLVFPAYHDTIPKVDFNQDGMIVMLTFSDAADKECRRMILRAV